ncbi:MAG: peptidoglycan DD-metalloendopeptidase family protein [Dongiaceae bacterium]
MAAGFLLILLSACNQSGRPSSDSPDFSSPPPAPPAESAASVPALDDSSAVYAVIPGDTVYGVAERFGVPTRTLIDVNGLKPPYRLPPGQKLRVPARQEHIVQPGESLFAIARIYAVDQSSLARVNRLSPPYRLQAGQRLALPGKVEGRDLPSNDDLAPVAASTEPRPATDGARETMTVEELPSPVASTAATGETTASPEPPDAGFMDLPLPPEGVAAQPPQPTQEQQIAAVPAPPPRVDSKFLWPLNGKIVSRFGPKSGGLHNDGVNITAPRGARVVAAENGVVAYAGNELRGFGNLLLIKHADGWVTAYAHNDQLLVRQGDTVTRGQAIARVGSSGNVSSPQLHFEIRRGAEPVDPMKYLGPQGAWLSPTDAPNAPPNPG